MQVIILAGGLGTRLAEETDLIPKPMVRIGPHPIIRHIMNHFAQFGHFDFIVAAGYKADVIKEYFLNETLPSNWRVSVVDTGLGTATGGRLLRLKDLQDDRFFLTYGDGLSNIDLTALLEFHLRAGKLATVTAVRPPARFGTVEIANGVVTKFSEKDPQDVGWINGGFFVVQKEFVDHIQGDGTVLEREPLQQLASNRQLSGYEHREWWQPMDTLRDKRELEKLWESGNPPWIVMQND
jgi:glucose-1-phosphate cytidylyltransferase